MGSDRNMPHKLISKQQFLVKEFDTSLNINSEQCVSTQSQSKIFLFFHPLKFRNFIMNPKTLLQVILWKHTYICDN